MSGPDVRQERLTQLLLTGVLLVASMLVGLAGQALIAYYFGAGTRSDSLFLARDVSDLAGKLLLTAQAVGVLVPFVVVLRAREGLAASDRALSAVLTTMALIGTALAVLLVLCAGPLVDILAPGFSDAAARQSVVLLRIVAPMTPFVAVAALATAALQARHRFGRAMVPGILGSAIVVAVTPVSVHLAGIEGAAAAMTIGVIGQAACGWALLLVEGVPAVIAPWRERRHVVEFARRTTPFLTYAAATVGSGITLRIAASLLGTGLYAAYALGYRLYRAVMTLLLVPVQQVLLPALSHSEAGGRREDSAAELVATLRYLEFLLVPITVALAALSEQVVSAVFERGAFSAGSAASTGRVLAFFSIAIVPTGVALLLEQAAYARRQTKLIVRVNLVAECVQGALYIPFVLALGASGIPIAVILAMSVSTSIYARNLRPAPLRAHVDFIGRLAACAAAMLAVVLATASLIGAALSPGPGLAQAVEIVPACLTGTAAYVVGARLAGLREPRQLRALLHAALLRGGGAPLTG